MEDLDNAGSPAWGVQAGRGTQPGPESGSLEWLHRQRDAAAHRVLDLTGWLASTQAKILAARAESAGAAASSSTPVDPRPDPDHLGRLREEAAELARQLTEANDRLSEHVHAIAVLESGTGTGTAGTAGSVPAPSDAAAAGSEDGARSDAATLWSDPTPVTGSPGHPTLPRQAVGGGRTADEKPVDTSTSSAAQPSPPQVRWEP